MGVTFNNDSKSLLTYNNETLDFVVFNGDVVYEKLALVIFFTGKYDAKSSNYPIYIYSNTLPQQSIYGENQTFTFWIPKGDRVTLDFSKYRQYYTSQLPYESDLDDGDVFCVDIAGLSQNYRIFYDCRLSNPAYNNPNYDKSKITFTMDKTIYVHPYECEYLDMDFGAMGYLRTRSYSSSRSTSAIFEAEVKSGPYEVSPRINLTDVVYS